MPVHQRSREASVNVDCIFEKNYILRLIIRRAASVDIADCFIACTAGKVDARVLLYSVVSERTLLEMKVAFPRSKVVYCLMRQLQDSVLHRNWAEKLKSLFVSVWRITFVAGMLHLLFLRQSFCKGTSFS